MIPFQGNGSLKEPTLCPTYISTYNSEGRGITRTERRHCVRPFSERLAKRSGS